MNRIAAGALAALALTATAVAQESAVATDWAEVVAKAHDHPRFAIKRAAANKLVSGGADAVRAIRAWLDGRDRNELSALVVDAYARSLELDPAAIDLLAELAADADFYWRSQALAGLAAQAMPRFEPLFRSGVADPSHLFRRESVVGLLALDPGLTDTLPTDAGRPIPDDPQHPLAIAARLCRDDPDPRARAAIALFLLRAGSWAGLPELVALVEHADATWLDDPWAARLAVDALRAMRDLGGPDFQSAVGDPGTDRDAARQALRAWATERLDDPSAFAAATARAARAAVLSTATGGIDLRSCRNGDLFVAWTPDGVVHLGLQPTVSVALPGEVWEELRAGLGPLAGKAVHGRVVCDYVRVLAGVGSAAEVHRKAAPGELPVGVAEWVAELVRGVGARGGDEIATALTHRLPQFH